MGNDLSVVNAARVSFGNKSEWDYEESDGYSFKQHLSERDRKLIHYLAFLNVIENLFTTLQGIGILLLSGIALFLVMYVLLSS
jgi:hypothetical protein